MSSNIKTFSNFVHDKEHDYWKQAKEVEFYVDFQLASWGPDSAEKTMESVLDKFSVRDYLCLNEEIYNSDFNPKKIIDLGCGTGRFSCFVNMNLTEELSDTKFYLADFNRTFFNNKDKPSSIDVFGGSQGYVSDAEPKPYNDFEAMSQFCSYYGLKNFENIDLDTDEITKLRNVDLIYSVAAVGYHWSVQAAVEKYKICDILKPGGKMICQIDNRNGDVWKTNINQLTLDKIMTGDDGSVYGIWAKQ
jgi:SAM-dependent methyltransferase